MPNKIPKTAQDALALWDAGEAVPAFRVEAEDSEQETIYAAAFELIRHENTDCTKTGDPKKPLQFGPIASSSWAEFCAWNKLTDRELEVSNSIAHVAILKGWSAMLRQHIGEHIPSITVQKPNDAKTPAHA
jgi:hypothetical protein